MVVVVVVVEVEVEVKLVGMVLGEVVVVVM